MSGSAGGNRILRQDVEQTVLHYKQNILEKYNEYAASVITGSYRISEKKDFGDIDLIVQLNDNDKKQAKIDFSDFLSGQPSNLIVPFKSVKYSGKRFLNTGEIVTILYPIVNNKGFVQIDNIISLSTQETDFKNHFLSLPAIKQGLVLGLIKTAVIENPKILNSFPATIALQHNQEYEFNLSSSGLTLRLVTLTPDYKTINKKDIWTTQNWNVIEHLLEDYDFENSFETIVTEIKDNLKNPRSINRIKGIFKSMVSVKSGELNTLKGDEKQQALNLISNL